MRRYFEAHLAIKIEQVKQSLQRTEGGILVHPQPPYKVRIVLYRGLCFCHSWDIFTGVVFIICYLMHQIHAFLEDKDSVPVVYAVITLWASYCHMLCGVVLCWWILHQLLLKCIVFLFMMMVFSLKTLDSQQVPRIFCLRQPCHLVNATDALLYISFSLASRHSSAYDRIFSVVLWELWNSWSSGLNAKPEPFKIIPGSVFVSYCC